MTNAEPKVVVYEARNALNGHRYIGVTKQGLHRRKYGHFKDARTGKGSRFHNAIRKYGADNFIFSVLHDFEDDYDLARVCEHEYICKHRPEYNLTWGGEGGSMHQSTKDKLRAINLGRKASAETRAKMAASQTGRPPTKGRRGQPRSAEEREKIRRSLKEAKWVDTPARIASRARTGASAASEARKIAVECVNDGRVFESLKAAAEFYGLVPTKLSLAFRKGWRIRGMRFIRRRAPDSMPSGQPDGTY
jgi:group I intron endonuclease